MEKGNRDALHQQHRLLPGALGSDHGRRDWGLTAVPAQHELPAQDWIMERWEEGYYITSITDLASAGLSCHVQGHPTRNSPKVSDSFPSSGSTRREGGLLRSCMGTSNTRWAWSCRGMLGLWTRWSSYFQYPSERSTAVGLWVQDNLLGATPDQAFVLSIEEEAYGRDPRDAQDERVPKARQGEWARTCTSGWRLDVL